MTSKSKKVLIAGREHDPELVKKVLAQLEEEGTEIVNIEDVDDNYKECFPPMFAEPDPYIFEARDMMPEFRDLYANVPKWARGRVTERVRTEAKIGNNEPCPCGSGLKYKKCCK